ncbi:hypothetical protein J6590_081642 [Homalodisca vitripennis]|nr:hypothetical protein J6590_081642 [Homalodisca vitripennis]
MLPNVYVGQLKELEARLNDSIQQDEAMGEAVNKIQDSLPQKKEQTDPISVQQPTTMQPTASSICLGLKKKRQLNSNTVNYWAMITSVDNGNPAVTLHLHLASTAAADLVALHADLTLRTAIKAVRSLGQGH